MGGFDIGSFLGSVISATGLGIGRSGMHPQAPSDILREASQLGVSPLVLLGGGSSAMQGGFGAQVGDPGVAGQLLARSMGPKTDDSKMQALREQNLALQNAQLSQDITATQLRNSHQATQMLAAGSPPTIRAGTEGSPFFGPVNPFGSGPNDPTATLQRNADGSISRTKSQAEIAFSGDPWMMLKQFFDSMGRDINSVGPRLPTFEDLWARPDLMRQLNNIGDILGR